MSKYAEGTAVSADRSEAEIKRTLIRYGADEICSGQSLQRGVAFVQFHYRELPLEARIQIPKLDNEEFWTTPGGKRRRERSQAVREWEKSVRQQWRVLLLLIKAKLEAVENGIAKAEIEFLPWLMLPNGQCFGQLVEPHVTELASSGKLPKLLTAGKA